MGGSCTAAKPISLYHKADFPECINLTFNFDKSQMQMAPDMRIKGSLNEFDDIATLKPAKAFYIESLIVYYDAYISGITVGYKIDGKHQMVSYLGSKVDPLDP